MNGSAPLALRYYAGGAVLAVVALNLLVRALFKLGGVSATLNLRQDGRASIIMVSPLTTSMSAISSREYRPSISLGQSASSR